MSAQDPASRDTEIVRALSTVIEQIARWGGALRAAEGGRTAGAPSEGGPRYVLELIDARTKSLINEHCCVETRWPLPIPQVGEVVGGPGTEPYRVVKRTFKYRVEGGSVECHVVLYCVSFRHVCKT